MNEDKKIYEKYKLPDELQIDKNLLWSIKPEKPHKVKINGILFDTPRLQQAYGRDYLFSGTVSKSKEIPDYLKPFLVYFTYKYGYNYNMLLINWYRDGKDYIGYHSDDERQIVPHSPIITITLMEKEECRDFKLKSKTDNKDIITIPLEDKDVLVMLGNCQKTHLHSVPKRLKVKGWRISITLRAFK